MAMKGLNPFEVINARVTEIRNSAISFLGDVLKSGPTQAEKDSASRITERNLGIAIGMEMAARIIKNRMRNLEEEEQQ